MDWPFLQQLSDALSVATACAPVMNLAAQWLGDGFERVSGVDSFALFHRRSVPIADLSCLFVAHVDEIGGCVLGTDGSGWYRTRCWGCSPLLYARAPLQAMDYLAESAASAFPIESRLEVAGGEMHLRVRGADIRPYRTVWTFIEQSAIADGHVTGKALDPRATVFAVLSAVRDLNDPRVGVLLVMAEECFMDAARKAVVYLQRESPGLRLVVNADVPLVANLADAQLDLPAIRPYEGRNLVDPGFAIRMAERLAERGAAFHLSAARSGSQTPLFSPLAPTVSVALPGEAIHTARARMSLTGIERCAHLLKALACLALE
jgi:putative aminopeptidase FrvX